MRRLARAKARETHAKQRDGSAVSGALAHARARQAQRRASLSQAAEQQSDVHEAALTRDARGFGLAIEMRRFEGEHLGSLAVEGYAHLVVSVDLHGPAHRRGFQLLDRVLAIDDEARRLQCLPLPRASARPLSLPPLTSHDITPMVEGKQTVVFIIERYKGDALLNLAWHMAIAACLVDEPDMLEPCLETIATFGMDARRMHLRRDDAREFLLTEGVQLLPGSTLADVATAARHDELAEWLLDGVDEGEYHAERTEAIHSMAEQYERPGGEEGAEEDVDESSTTQEYATPRSQLSSTDAMSRDTPRDDGVHEISLSELVQRATLSDLPLSATPPSPLPMPSRLPPPSGLAFGCLPHAPTTGVVDLKTIPSWSTAEGENEGADGSDEEVYSSPCRGSPRRQAELLSNASGSSRDSANHRRLSDLPLSGHDEIVRPAACTPPTNSSQSGHRVSQPPTAASGSRVASVTSEEPIRLPAESIVL
ncbi:hypothetical protein AB1Y20_008339 [Prymnesium parvum]|uniref:PDZ domain-containing protein n=1 Tax=Prymnesium parvum TaxID=97485 RepID=A0AB34IW99_PRYPA